MSILSALRVAKDFDEVHFCFLEGGNKVTTSVAADIDFLFTSDQVKEKKMLCEERGKRNKRK